MAQHQQWITLDSCITDYLNGSEQGMEKYFKLYHLAFSGMDDMGLDFFYQVQSFKLPVPSTKIVALPPNCLRYVKGGVLNDRGEVIPIDYNSKLTKFADLLPDRVSKVKDNNNPFGFYWWDSPIFYNYYANGFYGNLYGIPSGKPFAGSYCVDEHNGQIVLDPNFHWDYLIVECLVSPSEEEKYSIPIQFRMAMITWLSWQDIAYMPPSPRRGYQTDKKERERIYYNERRKAIAKYHPMDWTSAYTLNIESNRLVPKM
jgi:hypothetical protein